jgi:hypothetical protein
VVGAPKRVRHYPFPLPNLEGFTHLWLLPGARDKSPGPTNYNAGDGTLTKLYIWNHSHTSLGCYQEPGTSLQVLQITTLQRWNFQRIWNQSHTLLLTVVTRSPGQVSRSYKLQPSKDETFNQILFGMINIIRSVITRSPGQVSRSYKLQPCGDATFPKY